MALRLWLVSLLLFGFFADARDCGLILNGKLADFGKVIRELESLGFSDLTAPFREDQIHLKESNFYTSFHADIGISGNTLLVRRMPRATPTERQQSIWAVASALFEYQTAVDLQNAPFADASLKGMLEAADSLAYVKNTEPKWTPAFVERLNAREARMFQLLEKLDKLKAADLLPAGLKTSETAPKKVWYLSLRTYVRAAMIAATMLGVSATAYHYQDIETQSRVAAHQAINQTLVRNENDLVQGIRFQLSLPLPDEPYIRILRDNLKHMQEVNPDLPRVSP